MNQLDRVAPELLPQLDEFGPPMPVSRQNVGALGARSSEYLPARLAFGSTKPEKIVIDTQDGPLDLIVFNATTTKTQQSCLLLLHGGGYFMGSAKDKWFGPLFAERSGCTVVSVEYRVAPEHQFPAGLHDSFAALKWVHSKAGELEVDPDRIAIGGISAGGGLAAGLALYNRDQAGPPIAFQLLLCPMIDNLHDTASGGIENSQIWPRASSLAAWEMYLDGVPGHDASPYAAASRAADLSGLPPAMISVGEVDLFHDENRDYAERLQKAGIECAFRSYPGVFHGAEMAGYATEIGRRITDDYVGALRNALQGVRSGIEGPTHGATGADIGSQTN